MKTNVLLLFVSLFVVIGLVQAKDKNAPAKDKLSAKEQAKEEAAIAARAKEFEQQLKFEQGSIKLKNGLATLNVPKEYRFLGPDDAQKVLVEAWGNPPGTKPLGMLFRSDVGPASDNSWGVVITYDEDGYVKDDEAEKINYSELLKNMQDATAEANAARQQAGYEKVTLIGWAEPPHYDKAAHKLYWAKELQFGAEPEHTLNYDIRALGRAGVLSLNAVSSTKQLQTVQADMQKVLAFVEFNEGHRYRDFVPGADKVATYGIGALIAGKLAAKAGLFKIILSALLAAKKFVVVGLVALGALLKKLFSRKSSDTDETLSLTSNDSKPEES